MRLAVNHKLQCSASAAFMRAVGVTSLEFISHVHFVELERTGGDRYPPLLIR